MKKYCTRCGHKFEGVGREVICPECRESAKEEAKKAAVLRAKRASWTGESVPVRISGRASAVIRAYGADNSLPFAAALDALLQASDYIANAGKAWADIKPYKSHRRDKPATQDKQDAPQAPQASKPQDGSQTAQVAKTTSKTSKTSK